MADKGAALAIGGMYEEDMEGVRGGRNAGYLRAEKDKRKAKKASKDGMFLCEEARACVYVRIPH